MASGGTHRGLVITATRRLASDPSKDKRNPVELLDLGRASCDECAATWSASASGLRGRARLPWCFAEMSVTTTRESNPTKPIGPPAPLNRSALLRYAWLQFLAPPGFRHNGRFDPRFDLVEEGALVRVLWRGRTITTARRLTAVILTNETVHILAGGESLKRIARPERLFKSATICVDGAHQFAAGIGARPGIVFLDEHSLPAAGSVNWVCGTPAVVQHWCITAPASLAQLPLVIFDDWNAPFRADATALRLSLTPDEALLHPLRPTGAALRLGPGLFTTRTGAFAAAQLALAAGIRRLVFFGLDLGGRRKPDHKSLHGSDRPWSHEVVPAFEVLARVGKDAGVVICNANPESRLPDQLIQKQDPDEALAAIA